MLKEFKFVDIVSGLSLGEFRVTPTKTQLFMFSAITWNRHQIHFNKAQAEAEGFPDIVVQRGLIGNFLAQYVSQWISHHGYLKKLQWKVIQSTFPGSELNCIGEVISVSDDKSNKEIRCALSVVNEMGAQIAEGEARLQLYNENCLNVEGDNTYG